jgi:hypothetical protein
MTSSAMQILVGTVMLGVCVGLVLLIVKTAHGMGSQATQQADQSSSVVSSPTPSEHITSGGSKPAAEAAAKPSATTAVAGPTAASVPSPRTITVVGTLSHPRSPAPAPVRPPKPRPVPVRSAAPRPAPSPVPVTQTPTTQTPTTSTFTATAHPSTSVVQSAPANILGRLTPGGYRAYKFQKLVAGTWQTISTGRTNSSGYTRLSVSTKLTGAAGYRFCGTGTGGYGARSSSAITITIKAGITAVFSSVSIPMGNAASLTGKDFPVLAGRAVYLQRYYSSAWHTAASGQTNLFGNYEFALPTAAVGGYSYRVNMPGLSASHPASITSGTNFTVVKWTSALCAGTVVATSHVIETARTATLAGTVTNETGFDVQMNSERPVVEAVDTNGDGVRLFGDFYTAPDSRTYNLSGVLHAGQSVSYRGQPVTMQTPDRPWMVFPTWSADNQFSYNVSVFCRQRSVPGFQILQ